MSSSPPPQESDATASVNRPKWESARHARRQAILSGPIAPTVFWLAVPVLFEQLLSFLVGFVDTWLAGNLPGTRSPDASTAVGIGAYIGWLAAIFFGLIGTGTTALISRAWGAGNFAEGNRIMNRSLVLAAALGVITFLVIYFLAPWAAFELCSTESARVIATRYMRLDAFGHLFTSLTLAGAAALRASGDMKSSMYVLSIVNLLNVIASIALTYGIGPIPWLGMSNSLFAPLGVDGIVFGTVIARVGGTLLMLTVLSRGVNGLRIERAELSYSADVSRRILRIGLPSGIDGVMIWIGQVLFLKIIKVLPENAEGSETGQGGALLAAHFVGIEVEAISYLPAFAWGVAAATLVGQSLGAGNVDRARQAGLAAIKQCGLLAVGTMLLFYFAAVPIFDIMHNSPAVRAAGVPAFRLMALFQPALMIAIISNQALKGAGDTRVPLVITIIGMLLLRLPVAWLCGIVLGGGLVGAWIGMGVDLYVRAALLLLRFLRGKWASLRI